MACPVNKVLIIGGGFSGMAAAIQLRKRGIEVDLVEIDPGWRSYGAGISMGGASMRALSQLGVIDAFLDEGAASDGVEIFIPTGQKVAELPTPRIAGPEVPGNGAIMRPVLARILADATRASGANVRLGCTFTSIDTDASGVEVAFIDGSKGRYDLVIGADGLYSKVRETVFPDSPKPEYSGQGVWRAVLPRLPEVNGTMMWMGPKVKPGLNPVSRDEMYLFVTEDRATNDFIDPAEFLPRLKALLAPFPAPLLQQVREQLNESSQVIFRPLESMFMPSPWFKGRVVLIGDTVHATTPHMASGACIGIEDAIVLADELAAAGSVDQALDRYLARRWERCRMVVQNSGRLGEIEIAGGDKEEHARIMRTTLAALAAPI
ncbi:FAD-dependent oxidoreductase [Telluria mixta]|uniref:FAD-dependent oxidoreductase n=1 Tax=Telluria mixta TaxID=34071 RepID=A0ABT2BRZ1_9BURK|nr:FAD-dependent oxidoreductase [Telluria mixta]MCS0627882.1 FAD-dependent oxidoreductase [Telluria mixta]WEM93999.1 FAD-dependent oxidoreductase [Telluria mixta]